MSMIKKVKDWIKDKKVQFKIIQRTGWPSKGMGHIYSVERIKDNKVITVDANYHYENSIIRSGVFTVVKFYENLISIDYNLDISDYSEKGFYTIQGHCPINNIVIVNGVVTGIRGKQG